MLAWLVPALFLCAFGAAVVAAPAVALNFLESRNPDILQPTVLLRALLMAFLLCCAVGVFLAATSWLPDLVQILLVAAILSFVDQHLTLSRLLLGKLAAPERPPDPFLYTFVFTFLLAFFLTRPSRRRKRRSDATDPQRVAES